MAKEKMICPFSGKPCVECAEYRGRHYFLCYAKRYRGRLGEFLPEDGKELPKRGPSVEELGPPPVIESSSWLVLEGFAERSER